MDQSGLDLSRNRKRGRPAFPERMAQEFLQKTIQQAIDFIKSYESEYFYILFSDFRKRFYVFYKLPTKKQLPHYYTIISSPMDVYTAEVFIKINRKKIKV